MNDAFRPPAPRPRNAFPFRRGGLWGCVAAVLLAGALWGAGCSSSTDPGGGDGSVTIVFAPEVQGQHIKLSQTLEFSVTVTPTAPLTVSWIRHGVEVGTAADFTFVPDALGPDTLRVAAASGSTTADYYWVVTVEEDPSALPPDVPGIQVGPGPLPSEVRIQWNRVTTWTAFPVTHYLAAFSHAGPITEENWDQAVHLPPVVHDPVRVGYAVLADSTDGLHPGQTVWIAVRAQDEIGQLSRWSRDISTVVTWPWWVEGQIVLDDGSAAPPGIIVQSLAPVSAGNTDGTGHFRLGPFRSVDSVQIRTTSDNSEPDGWYDYQSGDLTYEDPAPVIVLVGRHGVDPECLPAHNPGGDFMVYFRWMTLTENDEGIPKSSILNRWDHYPLSIHVPDFVNGNGVDMGAAARQAWAIWNAEMGETYFVEAPDSASADIVFGFAPLIGDDGLTTLLLPAVHPVPWPGRVVPEKLKAELDSQSFTTLQQATEVSLHELGHCLGIWEHIVGFSGGSVGSCNSRYLMSLTAYGALDNAEPIHVDERHLVSAIRRLPQGVDLNRYLQGP